MLPNGKSTRVRRRECPELMSLAEDVIVAENDREAERYAIQDQFNSVVVDGPTFSAVPAARRSGTAPTLITTGTETTSRPVGN